MSKPRSRRHAFVIFAAGLLAWSAAAHGQAAEPQAPPITLDLPIACAPGVDCWISNYVDHDPGEAVRDYNCGTATYNVDSRFGKRHQGTDFALRDRAAMEKGVAVLAAATGVVIGTRDGMKDISARKIGADKLEGKFCGNGVAIRHANDFITQYCHMRQGSIAVTKGDRVKAGRRIGLVGLSGFTQYPHLHVTVRRGKSLVDPFVGLKRGKKCGLGAAPLWRADVLAKLPYGPSALYNAGFSGEKPSPQNARAGVYRATALKKDAPVLVLWVDIFQTRAGDKLLMVILAPDGKPLLEHERTLEKDRARSFAFAGKKRKTDAWPAGAYTGIIRLKRTRAEPGQKTYTIKRTVTVR